MVTTSCGSKEHRSRSLESRKLFGKIFTYIVALSFKCYICVSLSQVMRALFGFEFVFHARACCFLLCGMCPEYSFLRFIGFPSFTNVVQLLCSLSGWLHLSCSSIGKGFNGAETCCRIAHNLGILLMNSNCFSIFLQQHSSYVC